MTSSTPNPSSTPSPEDKAKVEALVAQCIEAMERGERDPATRVCGERPDLLTRVQRRLAHLAKHGLIPGAEPMPTTIGPYRIVRELGSGGMGTVYLAEQSVPVRREVALKVVKLGMDTREVVARFDAERQALAGMNHPHIAKVFDAGITAEGRPFFVMEFAAGEPLTTFADRRALTTERRVQLLATVCRAVQHAHDRGFIHRDLKPSNVLVAEHDGELAPKIIDFGIAKATAAAASTTDMATRVDQVLGTPEYMSPEQAMSGGLDVDTRSDVWSLGTMLYELLCSELPFDGKRLRRASRPEMEKILRDELPTLPSRRLSLAVDTVFVARRTDRSSLLRRLAGELDWITLKALHKERDARYPSALALAEDLERWLRKEPVVAAPPGRTYRMRKFAQRHRAAVFAGAAVLVSLVAGLATSLHATAEARRAEQEAAVALAETRTFFGLARDALGDVVDVADQRLAEVPQADAIRRELLEDALRSYETLRAQKPDDPELRLDLLEANHRAGVLQLRLGDLTAAVAVLSQCERELAALPAAIAAEPRAAILGIDVPAALAGALATSGHGDEARARFARALDALDLARKRADRAIPDADFREARLLASLGAETSDVPTAIGLFERALAAHERDGATNAVHGRDRARCEAMLASALTKQNRLDDAARLLAAAAARLGDGPASAAQREGEAKVVMELARVLRRLDRFDDARTAVRRAISLRERLAEEHPDLPGHAQELALGLQFLIQLENDAGRPADALPAVERAVAVRERLLARRPDDARFVIGLTRTLLAKGEVLLELWQHHGAAAEPVFATYERAATLIDPLVATAPTVGADVTLTYGVVHEALATLHEARDEVARARAEHARVRDVFLAQLQRTPDDPQVHGQMANVCSQLVWSHLRAADWDRAIAAGNEGLEHARRALALDARDRQTHAIVPQLVARLAAAHTGRGDPDAAIATTLLLLDTPSFDDDAREWGALLLGQTALEDPRER
ncbi:MAG: serine/threonine protein kinase, partial [Planctomycetes bacterium]|nr:serine/threonine protein kinase [Planctomycetota bacterium]